MAFNNNALTARLDELRSRNPPRVPSESNTGQNTPFRYSGSYMSSSQQPLTSSSVGEPPNLQRRFTADMSKMPIAPIGELSQNTEPLEMPNIVSPSNHPPNFHYISFFHSRVPLKSSSQKTNQLQSPFSTSMLHFHAFSDLPITNG